MKNFKVSKFTKFLRFLNNSRTWYFFMLGVLISEFIVFLFMNNAHAAEIQTCFTPQENCTLKVVNAISNAKKTVLVQAYSFTSDRIAGAVIDAHKRGAFVNVILDKSNFRENKVNGQIPKKSIAHLMLVNGVVVLNDLKPAIAHNKVIIIDGETVLTGSFNFTKAAQRRNAENLIIIKDKAIAKKYTDNFFYRRGKSDGILINKKCNFNVCHDEFKDVGY